MPYADPEKAKAAARRLYAKKKKEGTLEHKSYEQNKKYALKYRAKLRKDPAQYLRIAMKTVRWRAKNAGLPFELDLEWLQMQPMQCAITGKKFEIPEKGWGPLTPSFDQKIPGKGYTKENVQLICLWVNIAKKDWPESLIRDLIREAGQVV